MTAEVGVQRAVSHQPELGESNHQYYPKGGITPLMNACQQGKEQHVRQILHQAPNTARERDRTGKTALHYCAENTTFACIDQVVSADATLLHARDEDGYTPLHLATIAGNKVIAKYLLQRGADIHARDNEKHTAVHWATVCGEVELLDLLIDNGADPSTSDIHGAYPIHYAAQMCGPNSELGNDVGVGLQVLRKLLEKGADVSVTDHDGREPLLWAASAGSADAILALINAGANVSAEDKDGLTALHCAASRGHLECLDVLIELCGAEVDTLDSNGCTPLFYAVTLGHADCTELLLKHGAHPDHQDRKGRTPAHCGAAKGQLETLKLLHRREADLWKKNIKGDLPLHEACQSGRKDLVTWLLSMHPDTVDSPNHDGRTPLHIAAINNNIEICKVLMDNKASVNPIMRNSRGQLLTPVDAAVARGNRGCAKYLQLHGGTPAAKITDKRALQLAMQRALENGPTGPTGATPSDLTGDEFLSSSASSLLKSQESTMATSPIDMEVQTDAEEGKPDQRDAQTFTSEVNIREYLDTALNEEEEEHNFQKEESKQEEQNDVNGEAGEGKIKLVDVATNTTDTGSRADMSIQTSIEKETKDELAPEEAIKSDKDDDSKENQHDENANNGADENADNAADENAEHITNGDIKENEQSNKEEKVISDEKNISETADETNEEKQESAIPSENEKSEEEASTDTKDQSSIEKTSAINNINEDVTKEKSANEGKTKMKKKSKTKKTKKKKAKSKETISDDNDVELNEEDIRRKSKTDDEKVIEQIAKKLNGENIASEPEEDEDSSYESNDNKELTNDDKDEERRGVARKKKLKKQKASLRKSITPSQSSEENEISREREEGDGASAVSDDNIEASEDEMTSEEETTVKLKSKKKSIKSNSIIETHDEVSDIMTDASEDEDSDEEISRPKTVRLSKIRSKHLTVDDQEEADGDYEDNKSDISSRKTVHRNGNKRKSFKPKKGVKVDIVKPRERRLSRIRENLDSGLGDSKAGNKYTKDRYSIENDVRTHEMTTESSGRDYLMVQDAPLSPGSSTSYYSRETGDSGFKESGYSDTMAADQDSVGGDSDRNTEDDDPLRIASRKTRLRKKRAKKGNGDDDSNVNGSIDEDNVEKNGKSDLNGNGEKGARRKRISRSKVTNRLEGNEGEGDDKENEFEDEDTENSKDENGKTHRRPGERRGQVKTGALSGGPKKVENIETSLKERKSKISPATEVSLTQAMQTTMRKYALERKLFQQLLDLKRQQIRNTRANEHVLIKRMVDSYNKESSLLGMRGYGGAFTFNGYEKYLYDQLRFLQNSQGTKIPQFKATDDIEKLSKALRRAEILEIPNPLESPKDPNECNHSTHRCHHAVHAYTGVPCAAYLGHRKKKDSIQNKNKVNLPKIKAGATAQSDNPIGLGQAITTTDTAEPEPVGLKNYDPKKPLTVQLQHGGAKQQITLPTELLDKEKKYQLTFTIKENGTSDKTKSSITGKAGGKSEADSQKASRSEPQGKRTSDADGSKSKESKKLHSNKIPSSSITEVAE